VGDCIGNSVKRRQKMEKRGLSLAEVQEVPRESLILLVGAPGAGKSTFCHQAVLGGLAMDRPVIFVTTEHSPTEVIGLLGEKGMREVPPGALSFIDVFGETVGVTTPERLDTVGANCEDLNSISMAIAKLQQRIGKRDILLSFDSLTSPYLFNKEEVFRFIRLCLAKFASEGNSVLALMDEGCGKEEDLGAMMSIADGIIRMEIKENSRIVNVVKHPKVRPTRIELPVEPKRFGPETLNFDPNMLGKYIRASYREDEALFRTELGDFVNLFWPQFALWSGMLWDPKRFPMIMYEVNKDDAPAMFKLAKEDEVIKRAIFPWRQRLLLKFAPKNLSKVKGAKIMANILKQQFVKERIGIMEYLEDVSKTDEHYVRIYENYDCWGLENVGAAIASYLPPFIAGALKAMEYWQGLDRDWNAIETKCIGLGDPYCEFKLVPGEINGLRDSLEKDSSVIERIHERLMDRLIDFLLHGKPLVERPRLGSNIHIHPVGHAMFGEVIPAMGTTWSQRCRMAFRMGGAKSGKEVGERLKDAGLTEDEAMKRVLHLLEYCKVGKTTVGETIKIRENCESVCIKYITTRWEEPCCFFTTGFLNGFFSAVKHQHVREIKCVAAGDPYCEWEII
jgi:KaiC/GvpD/RAD55 family RecA-like ATPase/predicted hydrocarbon binding protein